MRFTHQLAIALSLAIAIPACAIADNDPLDGENDPFPDGKADGGIEAASPEARAVLALVNDELVTFEELDDDARLNKRAATNIMAHRAGDDGVYGTADDDRYDSLKELDLVRYVGPYALQQLLEYAIKMGYLDSQQGKSVEVIFSPMPYEQSHNVRVAKIIDEAQHSIDIAMYSYSDARIAAAIEAAVDRGVKIRMVFETASKDRTKTGTDLENTKSARLERMGVNVRWVNKIMHHKFMIVDGPRDDISRADTAIIETGSGNWSNGAATRYDENSLFFTGYRELALRLQKEFNLMWDHSKDLVVDASLPYELSTLAIDEAMIQDETSHHVHFTSDNFNVTTTTFRINGNNTVSDALVEAILGADTSIHIMSGHLRSRPVAEAIEAAVAANPSLDVRVYLDGQEYISSWYYGQQLGDLDDCVEAASTASQLRKCYEKGFYFSYQLHLQGIPVRFKYYAYRWHYSYAVQMHNKVLVIDGDELWTGSYNLSDNAEHNTFENMLVFKGPEFQALVAAYEAVFTKLWETGRADDLLQELEHEVSSSSVVPIVFEPMSLDWNEITGLKALIKSECPAINDQDYRVNPQNHYVCYPN